MKKPKYLLITCLFLCLVATLSAQNGNEAAGGEATGTGSSMSYSIGQTDYLMYTSDPGKISLGLQQPFLYSVPLEIPNTTVSDGKLLCFNAVQTVIVAGDGKHFIVEPILSQPLFEPETYSTFFKVYPNPTTGNFTLELLKVEGASFLLIESTPCREI